MTDRYSLRIDSGARAGDVVPLTHSPFLIGRNQDCDLRLAEPSVSGHHAELRMSEDRVHLHDKGSTNGTRIGRVKVGEVELEKGLTFSLGDVQVTLVEQSDAPIVATAKPKAPAAKSKPKSPEPKAARAEEPAEEDSGELELEWDDPAPADAPELATGGFAGQAAQTKFRPMDETGLGDDELLDRTNTVRSDHLAEAGRRSPWPLALLALSLVAAGAAYFFLFKGGEGAGKKVAAPTVVAGDLLKGAGSFEETAGWSGRDDWPAAFTNARAARVSGQQGLLAELGAGGRAQHVSQAIALGSSAKFDLQAKVRVEGQALVRLGLRWHKRGEGDNLPEPTLAYGPVVSAGEGFAVWQWQGVAPEGYDSASVVVFAWAPGTATEGEEDPLVGEVHVDEVVCLSAGSGTVGISLDEVHGQAIGDPAGAMVVHKIDRLLLTGVHALRAKDNRAMPLQATAGDYGIELAVDDATAHWVLTAAPVLVQGGISTMGTEGYLARRLDFEAEGVTDLVLGTGTDLVRVVLGAGRKVQGRPVGASFRFTILNMQGEKPLIKTRFGDDFKEALALASEAKTATREDRPGEALGKWKALLDRYPYEAKDVAEADAARTGLLREGFDGIKALEADLERARFFQLEKGFQDCAKRAATLADRYQGSELQAPIKELVDAVEQELKGFAGQPDPSSGHMQALLNVLREKGSDTLVQHLSEPAQGDR